MLALKFRGSLLGALIGDCLGAPFEGDIHISKRVLGNYFTTIINGKSKQNYSYTDDTAMTVSVAKSIIENPTLCYVDMAKKFVKEYHNHPNRGYGMNVVNVFDALRDTEFKDIYLPAKLQFNGSGSYGNGAAMRVAPIALFANAQNEEYIKNVVEHCSLITHAHPNGYNGAILQCLAIHAALKLDPSKEFDPLEFVKDLENKMIDIEKMENAPFCHSLNKIKEIYHRKQENITAAEIGEYLGNDVSAHKSVPTAIYAFLRGFQPLPEFECDNPFLRTIYFAISAGGDTDTIASMAGSISGAYHGSDVIPDTVVKCCELNSVVLNLADKLYDISQK